MKPLCLMPFKPGNYNYEEKNTYNIGCATGFSM